MKTLRHDTETEDSPEHKRQKCNSSGKSTNAPLVSVIMPVYNAAQFLPASLEAVINQTYRPLELSVYIDASDDGSLEILLEYIPKLASANVSAVVSDYAHADCIESIKHCVENETKPGPYGAGYAYNKAILQSNGEYLCFFDADDISKSDRISKQMAVACDPLQHFSIRSVDVDRNFPTPDYIRLPSGEHSTQPSVIVGCGFDRLPEDATPRYTAWLNRISGPDLIVHRFRECTIAKPTWLMSRLAYDNVPNGFDESGRGTPEDMIFMYRHLEHGGSLGKVDEPLMTYRYHSATHTNLVDWRAIWDLRVKALETQIIDQVEGVMLWGGKDANRLFRSLRLESQKKVTAFCDVSEKKIKSGGYYDQATGIRVPVIHFSQAKPLIITCVKLDLHPGFEENLAKLGLKEGSPEGFIMFS